VVTRGPHVMKGYWNDAAATSAAFLPGISILCAHIPSASPSNSIPYAVKLAVCPFVASEDDVLYGQPTTTSESQTWCMCLVCDVQRDMIVTLR